MAVDCRYLLIKWFLPAQKKNYKEHLVYKSVLGIENESNMFH